MKTIITLAMLLDRLAEEVEMRTLNEVKQVWVDNLRLISNSDYIYREDILYIGNDPVKIHDVSTAYPKAFFVCIVDDELWLTEHLFGNVVYIYSNVALSDIFNRLLSYFLLLKKWDSELKISVLQKNGLQDIFDLSEDILGNPVLLLDPAMKVAAYMTCTHTDDPLYIDSITAGYRNEESMNILKTHKVFELMIHESEKTGKPAVIDTIEESMYTLVSYPFPVGNERFYTVDMFCSNRSLTMGLLDLFQLFTSHIRNYLDINFPNLPGHDYFHEYFFVDLLDGKIISEEAVKERAEYFSIPFTGVFCIFKIQLETSNYYWANLAMKELAQYLPGSKLFIYRGSILAFMSYNYKYTDIESVVEYQISRIKFIIEKYDALCGISNIFRNLMQTPERYIQASEAIKIGEQLTLNALDLYLEEEHYKGLRIFPYKDLYIYHMIATVGNIVNIRDLCCKELFDIIEYDKKHNMDNFTLLYVYLQNERKATDTANELHMHRNNILYRVQRMEDAFHLNLDDPETRLRLLLSYKALNIYGKIG